MAYSRTSGAEPANKTYFLDTDLDLTLTVFLTEDLLTGDLDWVVFVVVFFAIDLLTGDFASIFFYLRDSTSQLYQYCLRFIRTSSSVCDPLGPYGLPGPLIVFSMKYDDNLLWWQLIMMTIYYDDN